MPAQVPNFLAQQMLAIITDEPRKPERIRSLYQKRYHRSISLGPFGCKNMTQFLGKVPGVKMVMLDGERNYVNASLYKTSIRNDHIIKQQVLNRSKQEKTERRRESQPEKTREYKSEKNRELEPKHEYKTERTREYETNREYKTGKPREYETNREYKPAKPRESEKPRNYKSDYNREYESNREYRHKSSQDFDSIIKKETERNKDTEKRKIQLEKIPPKLVKKDLSKKMLNLELKNDQYKNFIDEKTGRTFVEENVKTAAEIVLREIQHEKTELSARVSCARTMSEAAKNGLEAFNGNSLAYCPAFSCFKLVGVALVPCGHLFCIKCVKKLSGNCFLCNVSVCRIQILSFF